MSLSSLRLFRDGFSTEDCYGIPRTTLKELRETKFPRIMESVSVGGMATNFVVCRAQNGATDQRKLDKFEELIRDAIALLI